MTAAASTITAHTSVAGLHYWPDAPPRRAYLANLHRHLFRLSVTVPVSHNDRDVEFHDLQEASERALRDHGSPYHPESSLLDFGSSSCETLAVLVADLLEARGFHPIIVVVSEDGENEATIYPTRKVP